jgi:hypothetical protein
MDVAIRAEEFADECFPDDPEHEANYYGWDLYVTVRERTYRARRYTDAVDVTFFHFSDPMRGPKDWRRPFWPDDPDGDRAEPFRNGVIPYEDPLFQAAARAVLELPGVRRLNVFTSNEAGRPAPVDLSRLPRTD